MQEREPLGPKLRGHRANSGGVAVRTAKAGNETNFNRVRADAEDDRNCRRRRLRRECGWCAAWRDDDGYPAPDKIGHQLRQSSIVIVREAKLDRHISPVAEAGFA